MVQVWKSASQVLAFSFATYPPKREELARMKFCEIQNAFHCWEGSRCILYTDNGMHRVRMEPMAGHFFCFPTSFFFAPCFWSRLGQNSSGTLPCGSTKLVFFGCATSNSKKLMFLGRGLHRWRTIVCNAGRLQAGGGAMQCNAMQCNAMQARHMKAGGGEEIHSPPPVAGISRFNGREVATTWGRAATLIARGPIVVSRVYSLFVARCTMPCYRRLDCMVEWAKADLLQAALVESLRRHCHIWITLNWRQDWWNNAIHTNYTQVFVFLL